MFWKIAKFEFHYQLRQPAFYVIFLIFFLFSFAGVSVENLTIGGGGAEDANSPYQLMQTHLVLAIFGIFAGTVFVSNVVLRDFESKSAEIIFSTQIKKHQYLFGRFIGAAGVALLAMSSITWGTMLGSIMPWLDQDNVGVFRPEVFAYSFFVMTAPGLLFASGLFLSISAITRSLMMTYAGVLGFFVLYIIALNLIGNAELRDLGTLLDPFGFAAFSEAVRYWTISERNTLLIPLEGLFLANRLLWIGIGFGLAGLSYLVFKFNVSQEKRVRFWHRKARLDEPVSVKEFAGSSFASPTISASTHWRQFLTILKFEVAAVVRSIPFKIILAFGLINTLAFLLSQSGPFDTGVLPVTRAMINSINSAFTFVIVIVVIYYSSEIVWRDRQAGAHEIQDATPTPNWAFVLSKLGAVFVVVPAMFIVSIVTAMIFQTFNGYVNFELAWYAERLLFYQSFNLFLIAMLAVFFQVLTNNKYFGMLMMLLWLVSTLTLNGLGFEHNLYQFGGRPPSPISDMNGDGHFVEAGLWFQFYWLFFSIILGVLSYLMWNRGALVHARQRFNQIRVAFSPVAAVILIVAFTGFGATGSYIYYNTNVLNQYQSSDNQELHQVEYEEKFRQYEGMAMPRVIDVKADVNIYPGERAYDLTGTIILENRTDEPLVEVHTVFDPSIAVTQLALEGAEVAWSDEVHNYTAFALNAPLAPGEQLTLTFRTEMTNPGFKNSGNLSSVVYNGTFFNSFEATPSIGFNRGLMLAGRQDRRSHGLDPIDRSPRLEDMEARRNSYLSTYADWINFEATVSTVEDQVAIAPGYLEREWVEDGRRYFHYKMDKPIQNFFAFLSADYQVTRDKWNDVEIAIYYHDPHSTNVERMIRGVKKSLDYFTAEFSPYQYRQMRILEFPAYASFAQSFPNTVPYSEAIGFIADIGENDVDAVFYVTAHEVAHQWWAHQVMGANTQGGQVVVETLAQYSAMMAMEHEYGPQLMRRFLKRELDTYLRARGGEAQAELPLYRVENQGYIHYNKGSLVMYAMKDYLGEDAVNRALRKLIENHAYNYEPYTVSTDLIGYLREEATTDAQQQLITDLFERIVLFDLKVREARVSEMPDGKFKVSMQIEAEKLVADEKGKETKEPVDMMIDIGAFSANPSDARPGDEPEIYLTKHHINAKEMTIELILDERPSHVGIDPYNKLVDRNSDDNISTLIDDEVTVVADAAG